MPAGPDNALLREYEFSDEDFQRVRRLVREQIGISLAESKRELVYGRLARRLRALKLNDFDSYLRLVETGDSEEMQHFCNAITTNLTSFFRERHHFDFMADEWLAEVEKRNAATRRIRIWSAGCSTGEEPYSIAMTLLENMSQLRNWDVRILATDIDSNVLAHARRGLYAGDRLEKMEGARILRWFEKTSEGTQYQVRDELKQLITFNSLNLVGEWPMKGPFDLIFCRNVVIYFDRETQRQIVERMSALQRVGDHLILGHSESLLNISTKYRLVGHTIHTKVN